MRYLAIVAVLVAVSWLAPITHMPVRDTSVGLQLSEAIVTASLAGSFIGAGAEWAGAEWQAGPRPQEAGRGTLLFNVAPSQITQPILPEIPEPIAQISPDLPPSIPTDVASVSWSVPSSDGLPLEGPLSDGAPSDGLHQVTAITLNIRARPGSGAKVVAALGQGARALVTGVGQNGWVPVRVVSDGTEGWAFRRYLKPVPRSP